MFIYRKRLFYPVHVEQQDTLLAQALLEHYRGPNSELASAAQYLNHRCQITNRHVQELLGMIAAEEMSHLEIISIAIQKLGGSLTIASKEKTSVRSRARDLDSASLLQADIEMEARTKALYTRHLAVTEDPGVRRMLQFLINRETVHAALLQKAQQVISQDGPMDQFNELIYEYRVSLQVLE